MSSNKKEEYLPIARPHYQGIPLDELESRLEMQRMAPIEAAVACYTDFCPSDCTVHCGSGYSGCTDLCACDGTMCTIKPL